MQRSERHSALDLRAGRRFNIEFSITMTVWIATIFGSKFLVAHSDGWLKVFWALIQAIPVLVAVAVIVRHVRRIDEYQRAILYKGFSVGFAVAMVSAISIGLLDAAGVTLPVGYFIVYAAGMTGWLIAGFVLGRRN